MLYRLHILITLIIIASCSSKKQEQDNNSTVFDDKTSIKNFAEFTSLNEKATSEIKNWKEYHELKEFVNEFKSISATEALNNALELKRLTQQLKDSSEIDIMKVPAFKARVNVFENEVLRLADMTYIPSISSTEISKQIEKTLSLFGSINSKLNNIYLKKQFDSEINLDSLFK